MPMPPPRNSHSDRCLGVAFRSLGNHARGTETLRPSVRTTSSASLVHDTSTAVTSHLSAEVSIPLLQEKISLLQNDLSNFSQLVTAETAIVCQVDRLKPILRVAPGIG